MRRIGMKGGKRRKSETSSDADSGENGGGGNDTVNSDAGNDLETTTTTTTAAAAAAAAASSPTTPSDDSPVAKTTPNRKKSRGRSKKEEDTSSLTTETSQGKNDAEGDAEDASVDPDTTIGAEQENGNVGKSSAKKRKKEKAKVAASTSQENDEYEVEKIVAHRTIKGRRQFLVRWKGYGEDSDTWEQEKDLNCPKLIDDFLADEEEKTEENEAAAENENNAAPAKRAKTNKKNKKSAGKKEANKQKNDAAEEEVEESKEFEVEKIIEVHFKKNKTRDFLIRWKGFTAKDDTWEPEENLNCPELIEKFMEKVKKAKTLEARELRTNPAHTKHYTSKVHESGRRWSRRNVDKQRTTYFQCDE